MGEEESCAGANSSEGGEPNDTTDAWDDRLDAVDRLERNIDVQIDTLDGIDDKAEHVTRLVGLLVGLLFSVLSLVVRFDAVDPGQATLSATLSFTGGVLFLLLSMGMAVITYLSSRFRVGLHPGVGLYLAEDRHIDESEHLRRVLWTYGRAMRENRHVIETNSRRFRFTLYFLLVGLVLLSTAGFLFVGRFSRWQAVGVNLVAVAFVVAAGWYVLGGNYLAIEAVDSIDD